MAGGGAGILVLLGMAGGGAAIGSFLPFSFSKGASAAGSAAEAKGEAREVVTTGAAMVAAARALINETTFCLL